MLLVGNLTLRDPRVHSPLRGGLALTALKNLLFDEAGDTALGKNSSPSASGAGVEGHS